MFAYVRLNTNKAKQEQEFFLHRWITVYLILTCLVFRLKTTDSLKWKSLIHNKWDKVFKSGLSKFCGRHTLKSILSPLLNTLFQL